MVDIAQLATNLELADEGLWQARDSSRVSYPEDGNEHCLFVEDRSFWFRYRNLLVVEAIKRFPPPGAIFDIGGGNGYVSLGIKDAGFESVVVEPGRQGALSAYRRGLRPIIVSTLQDAKFKLGSLPAVGIFDVLEHISDDREFLDTLNRLLMPEGRLYVTVPAYRLLWSPEDARAGHFRRYLVRELRAKLEAAGFQVDFETYIFSPLVLPIFLFRTVPGWLGLRKERDPQRIRSEHQAGNSLTSRILERWLRVEIRRIAAVKTMPCGSSCLMVARSA